MDNATYNKLRLETIQKARTFQPFHKLVENKEAIKDLNNHTGYKLLKEYIEILVQGNIDELKNNYLTKTGRDVSDIIRGKLEALEGILKLEEAINSYIELKTTVESNK